MSPYNTAMNRIQIGDAAPEFSLPAQNGDTVRLGDYRGKQVVVLYFYPRDESPLDADGHVREALDMVKQLA